MGLFESVLGAGESLFANENALDPEFVPKLLPFRDTQQRQVASCIAPLIQGRNGRNAFCYGPPGIGKTAAIKWVLRDLEENTDEVHAVYVNCWQKTTTFQVYVDILHQLGYMFTQNKRTEELLEVLAGIVNKKAGVFVFDEVDKAEDLDFLYSILTDVFKRCVILITNYKEWITTIEDRLTSRFVPDMIEFNQYNAQETHKIIVERADAAFVKGVFDADALAVIGSAAAERKDIRIGIHLLRQAGLAAEEVASRRVFKSHAEQVVVKIAEYSLKQSDDLEEDTRTVLSVCKASPGAKIGDLFERYKEKGGMGTYKTFQRKIAKLEKHGFVTANKLTGREGNTTIVTPVGLSLSDFEKKTEEAI